jgi:hypothetical protein
MAKLPVSSSSTINWKENQSFLIMADLKRVSHIFSAHYGVSDNYDKAFSDWKEEFKQTIDLLSGENILRSILSLKLNLHTEVGYKAEPSLFLLDFRIVRSIRLIVIPVLLILRFIP